MDNMIGHILSVFMGFFAIMNPIANTPVFLGLTANDTPAVRKRVAAKALLTTFVIIVVFCLLGKLIFDLSKETDRFGDSKGTQLKVPDTDTVLIISGFIRGSAIHDFDKIASPTRFVPRDIVVNGQPTGQPSNRTTFTANASRFILGTTTPTERGKLSTFFSWDFDGNTTSSSASLRS